MPTDEEIRRRLRAFICDELMQRPDYVLGDDEPLFSGGLVDSFNVARLGVFIESAFGVFIPDTQLTAEGMDTIREIAARIGRA